MQGFLRRLLDPDDALARSLLRAATFRLVPCMNPDGAFRGHLRTNAGGANLNREWVSIIIFREAEHVQHGLSIRLYYAASYRSNMHLRVHLSRTILYCTALHCVDPSSLISCAAAPPPALHW